MQGTTIQKNNRQCYNSVCCKYKRTVRNLCTYFSTQVTVLGTGTPSSDPRC